MSATYNIPGNKIPVGIFTGAVHNPCVITNTSTSGTIIVSEYGDATTGYSVPAGASLQWTRKPLYIASATASTVAIASNTSNPTTGAVR
jgi:hypothetical protein